MVKKSLTQSNNGGNRTNGVIQNRQRTDTQTTICGCTLLSTHANDMQMMYSSRSSVVRLTVKSQTAGEPLTVRRRCVCPKRESATPNWGREGVKRGGTERERLRPHPVSGRWPMRGAPCLECVFFTGWLPRSPFCGSSFFLALRLFFSSRLYFFTLNRFNITIT